MFNKGEMLKKKIGEILIDTLRELVYEIFLETIYRGKQLLFGFDLPPVLFLTEHFLLF